MTGKYSMEEDYGRYGEVAHMKKYLIKSCILGLFIIAFICCEYRVWNYPQALEYDTFNIFHWKNMRFTTAVANKNYIKTKYVLKNPKKYNAFILGSSRIGALPQKALPSELNGEALHWYNMTYVSGTPRENFLTLKTFLENNVDVKMVMVGFDEIMLFTSYEQHTKELLCFPYQEYEASKIRFFRPYLMAQVEPSIKEEVKVYDALAHESETELFYSYGGTDEDFSLTENPDLPRYEVPYKTENLFPDSYKDLEEMVEFCAKKGITLVLFANPMFQILYRESVYGADYLNLLRNVAQKCEFYNFSALNRITTDPQYFFEYSHYRPVVGLMMEQLIFGTEEEKARIRREAGDELWGMKVNAENVDLVIQHLQEQLRNTVHK